MDFTCSRVKYVWTKYVQGIEKQQQQQLVLNILIMSLNFTRGFESMTSYLQRPASYLAQNGVLTFFIAIHACAHRSSPSSPGQGIPELFILDFNSSTWKLYSHMNYYLWNGLHYLVGRPCRLLMPTNIKFHEISKNLNELRKSRLYYKFKITHLSISGVGKQIEAEMR